MGLISTEGRINQDLESRPFKATVVDDDAPPKVPSPTTFNTNSSLESSCEGSSMRMSKPYAVSDATLQSDETMLIEAR